jgi:cellobiose-specific phosphotransferase system component IIA
MTVESRIRDCDAKEKLLAELTVSREQQIQEATARLDQVKQEYSIILDQRSTQSVDFNRMKAQLERAHAKVLGEYQSVATKRQYAQARVTGAESKKLEAEVQIHTTLDDLKIHLLTIKEQLGHAIEEAHTAQEALIQREAEEKAREEAMAVAQELLKVEQKEKEKGGGARTILTVNERRKASNAAGKRKLSSPQRVPRHKTAPGAPIVTPLFDGETGNP